MGLWVLERTWRFFRFLRINGGLGKKRRPATIGGRPYRDTALYGMRDYPTHFAESPYTDKTLPRIPSHMGITSSQSYGADAEFGVRGSAYYDEGSLQPLASYEERYRDGASTPTTETLVSRQDGHYKQNSVVSLPMSVPVVIPVGYAHAQTPTIKNCPSRYQTSASIQVGSWAEPAIIRTRDLTISVAPFYHPQCMVQGRRRGRDSGQSAQRFDSTTVRSSQNALVGCRRP